MRLAVRYVNGHLLETTVDGWSLLRSDGVDHVDLVGDGGGYRLQGRSVLWLRRDQNLWVLGGGTVRDVTEVALQVDGSFDVRSPEFMPDLPIDKIKLGHWEPGTAP